MYNRILPEYGELLTVEEFHAACECGSFIDYDGFGNPVKGSLMSDQPVYPSTRHVDIPSDATHIIWYNR